MITVSFTVGLLVVLRHLQLLHHRPQQVLQVLVVQQDPQELLHHRPQQVLQVLVVQQDPQELLLDQQVLVVQLLDLELVLQDH
jgi:hypothetical protein